MSPEFYHARKFGDSWISSGRARISNSHPKQLLTKALPNDIVVNMAAEHPFDANGNLPPGIHEFDWETFSRVFGGNDWRRTLLAGMLLALRHLESIGCQRAYIDGSFTTTKEFPGDYDGCWERAGINLRLLDSVLLDFSPGRKRQKAKYLGEWFPANVPADAAGKAFIEFFQTDRAGNRKGVVAIDLGGLP
jgi:hypothetical protein